MVLQEHKKETERMKQHYVEKLQQMELGTNKLQDEVKKLQEQVTRAEN